MSAQAAFPGEVFRTNNTDVWLVPSVQTLGLDPAALARKALLADTANRGTAVDGILVEAASVQLLLSVQLLVLKDGHPMWYCVA